MSTIFATTFAWKKKRKDLKRALILLSEAAGLLKNLVGPEYYRKFVKLKAIMCIAFREVLTADIIEFPCTPRSGI